MQCIDATGTGDVTKTHSVWRKDGIKAGYTALVANEGIVYVVNDLGNMLAFDAESGEQLWDKDLGTVGKGSPVFADGKLYAPETNGNFHILKPSREECKTLCSVRLPAGQGLVGMDEIYSSPAISDGKIYLVTRDRMICIGDPDAEWNAGEVKPMAKETPSDGVVDLVQLRPYERILKPGDKVDFSLVTFDANGVQIDAKPADSITLDESLSALKSEGGSVMVPGRPRHGDRGYAVDHRRWQGGHGADPRIQSFTSRNLGF